MYHVPHFAATDTTNSLNLVTATAYNPAGLPTSITYGNASTGSASDVDSFTYDPNTYRPTNLTYSINPTTSPYNVTTALTWNGNWSLQKMVYTDGNDATKDQTCTYSADDLSRIASTSCGTSTWGQTFTYDPFGNIKKSVPSGYSGTAYAAAYSTVTNQVSTGITPAPTYDKNGNQLTSTPATLTWNALNVPITVATASDTTTAIYDALGLMVEMTATESPRSRGSVYRPDGALLAIDNYSSGLEKGYVPLPGGSTAIYNAFGLSYIRHKDWLGSSRLATTWAHAVYSKEAYAPFGETYNEAGTADRSFTGQDQDVVTGSGGAGVYDFLFRKQDPSGGRWMSPDPSGWEAVDPTNPQSFNRYAYVTNNPLSFVDQFGFDPGDINSVFSGGCILTYGVLPSSTGYNPEGILTLTPQEVLLSTFCPLSNFPTSSQPSTIQVGIGGGGGGAPNKMVMTPYPNPANAVPCSTSTGVNFLAPPGFSVSNIAANGATNGWSGKEAAVGQFGYYDYQRYVTGSNTFNFYYRYTPVSNIAVGAYLQGAGYAWAAGAISDAYAWTHSANGATAQQAQFRNLGISLASGKATYTCQSHP